MNKLQLLSTVGACSLAFFSQSATALTFDQNITPNVIMGSGIGNGGWTVDQSNGVELGLRGKLRHPASNIYNSNGDGTYTFATGLGDQANPTTGEWSFEWSINTDYTDLVNRNLADLTYVLGIDSDPGAGQIWTTFDPINGLNPSEGNTVLWDHALGNNGTAQSGGSPAAPYDVAGYASSLTTNNVAQNSWKATWFLAGYDPFAAGEYDFYLEAYDGATLLARTDITINAVPVPAAVWLFGSALGLLGWVRRRTSLI